MLDHFRRQRLLTGHVNVNRAHVIIVATTDYDNILTEKIS